MWRNYLKIAWRSLRKSKLTALINILGLALGLGICFLIGLFVWEEYRYDAYFTNSERLYRVTLNAKVGQQELQEASVMAPVAQTFKSEIPEVEDATRLVQPQSNTKIQVGDQTFRNAHSVFADPNFFQLFDLAFVQGDPQTALSKPYSVVLTEDQAKMLFNNQDPINRTIALDQIGYYSDGYRSLAGEYTVTGVVENIPSNTHFHFDLFISMLGFPDATNSQWLSGNYVTYLLLRDGIDPAQVNPKILPIIGTHMESQMKEGLGMSFEEFFEKGNFVFLNLQPLKDIHLNPTYRSSGDFEAGGDYETVMIYVAIAVFMLLIACVNFVNLSTAGGSKRIKEIGVRKVMGSEKAQLMIQFLAEAFVMVALSVFLALIGAKIALPIFNDFTGKSLSFPIEALPEFTLVLLGVLVLVTILAGGYPAFFLSRVQAIDSLKKNLIKGKSRSLRSSLVVFQFAVSVGLFLATLVVSSQMDFIKNKDIGYDRGQLLVLREAGLLGDKLDVFKDRLKADSRVLNVSKSAYIPAGPSDNSSQNILFENSPDQTLRVDQYGIDEEYLATMGMELKNGRNFSLDFGNEKDKIILNETASKELGIEDDPIGKALKIRTDLQGGTREVTVIGVVKDFVAKSLREPIRPLIMVYDPYYSLILKVDSRNLPGLLKDMKSIWDGYNSGEEFHYAFLDELYHETYLQEEKMGSFLKVLSGLTIFVACLGLFGLVTFTAEQRVKEIGIRKVLGATIPQIVGMLAKDFLKLVALALVIALPLGYYLMGTWLQNFAYHIEISGWSLLISAGIMLGIALITISIRSVKAAIVNPARVLKSE